MVECLWLKRNVSTKRRGLTLDRHKDLSNGYRKGNYEPMCDPKQILIFRHESLLIRLWINISLVRNKHMLMIY